MNNLIKKIIFGLYYLAIIFLSINDFNCQELKSLYDFFNDKDKIMHFFQYFILALLALFSFQININLKNFILLCLFIIISSGMSEFIQMFLSSRDSSYIDCLYDISGGVFGFIVFVGIKKICYKKSI